MKPRLAKATMNHLALPESGMRFKRTLSHLARSRNQIAIKRRMLRVWTPAVRRYGTLVISMKQILLFLAPLALVTVTRPSATATVLRPEIQRLLGLGSPLTTRTFSTLMRMLPVGLAASPETMLTS